MGSGLYKYNTEGKNENMKCQKLVDKIQGRLSYTLTLALNEIRIQIKTSENWGGATQRSVEQ